MPTPTNEKDLLQPPHMLQEGEIFGCPYHGLVEGGSLPVSGPNPDIPYPQPGDGSTRVVGGQVSAPVRNPVQAASDTANGFEWKNTAIVAGNDYILHGQSLRAGLGVDEWHSIYTDDNNVPWLMKITDGPTGNAANFRLNVTLVAPFGRFKVNIGVAPDAPFNIPLITNYNPGFTTTPPSGAPAGGFYTLSSNSLDNLVEQNKKGDEIVVHVAASSRLGFNIGGVGGLLKVEFSGNGDLTDGSGISAVASVFKDQDECYIEGDVADGIALVDTLRGTRVIQNDLGLTVNTTVPADPSYCDSACTPFPCEVVTTITRTCTRQMECNYSTTPGLYTDVGMPVGSMGAVGAYDRVTLDDEVTIIQRAYYDNDVLTTIGAHRVTRFTEAPTMDINGNEPADGFPVGDTHEVTSITEWDSACVATGGLPDRIIEVRTPVTRDKTTDFVRLIDSDQVSVIETIVELLVDGAVDETLTFTYTRSVAIDKNYTDGDIGVTNIDADIGFIPQSCGNTIGFVASCGNGMDVVFLTDAASTDTYTRTVDHVFEINGVPAMTYQEVNESIPNVDHIPAAADVKPQFDGPVVQDFAENPDDLDWFDAYVIDLVFLNNRMIAVDVDIQIDVDGSAPGQFTTTSRYNLFSGSDKIVGETDDFASIDPDTGLITQSTSALCFV